MRTYEGVPAHALPPPNAPDFTPRLRSMLTTIDLWIRDASFGFARINAGEVPNGSGTSIGETIDLADYFKLSGRSGGQVAAGGTVAGDVLTLFGSTGQFYAGAFVQVGCDAASSAMLTIDNTANNNSTGFLANLLYTSNSTANTLFRIRNTSGAFNAIEMGGGGTNGFLNVRNTSLAFLSVGPNGTVLTQTNTGAAGLEIDTIAAATVGPFVVKANNGNTLFSVGSLGDTNDSRIRVGRSGSTAYWELGGGSAPTFLTSTANNNRTLLVLNSVASYWSDTKETQELRIGESISALKCGALLGNAGNPLDRLGISSSYTVLTGGATTELLAQAANEMVRVVNVTGTHGADTWVPLRVESKRAGQSGDLVQAYIDNAGSPLLVANLNASGVFAALGVSIYDSSTTSGFKGNLLVTASIANVNYNFPDHTGNVAVDGGNETYQLTLSTTGVLRSNTSSIGASFAHNADTTKKLRVVLSGAVGNNSITLTNSAARNYGLGNLGGNLAVVGDNTGAAASGKMVKVDLTGQTAGIGSTNMTSSAPTGMYLVDVVAICTTASGSGAPTLDVTIGWTDVLGATTEKTINALSLSATGRAHGATRLVVSSAEIAYSTTINASSGSPQYALYIRVTYLG